MTWVVLVVIVLYMVPICVAVIRGSKVGPVVVINVFLGWTVIGWITALVLAVWPKEKKTEWVAVPYDGETYRKGRVILPGRGDPRDAAAVLEKGFRTPPTPNIEISTEIPEGGGQRSA